MENVLPGRQTGAAHMVTNLKFTVIEPMGMTLIDRMYEAVKDHAQQNSNGSAINYGAATYLMVIRFFGYDEAGNLVNPGTTPGGANSNPKAPSETSSLLSNAIGIMGGQMVE